MINEELSKKFVEITESRERGLRSENYYKSDLEYTANYFGRLGGLREGYELAQAEIEELRRKISEVAISAAHDLVDLKTENLKVMEAINVFRSRYIEITKDAQKLVEALNDVMCEGHSNLCQTMKPYRPNYTCSYEYAEQALAEWNKKNGGEK